MLCRANSFVVVPALGPENRESDSLVRAICWHGNKITGLDAATVIGVAHRPLGDSRQSLVVEQPIQGSSDKRQRALF